MRQDAFFQAGEEDVGILQAFGSMERHHENRRIVTDRVSITQKGRPIEKVPKSETVALFVVGRRLTQLVQVLKPILADRRRLLIEVLLVARFCNRLFDHFAGTQRLEQ